MNVKRRPSTRIHGAAMLLVALTVTACTTALTPQESAALLSPVEMAASQPLSALETRAEAGDARAQLALSIALQHGLQGARDPGRASFWRMRASAARGYRPITQYTAAFNGQPSRVNIINVPSYEVTGVQLALIDACTARLSGGQGNCGDSATEARLQAIWDQAN